MNPPQNGFGTRLILVVLFQMAALWLNAQTSTNYTFVTNSGTLTSTGYNGPGGGITVPDAIGGLTVTAIADYAFDGLTNVTSVVLPDSVASIGYASFYNCSALTNIII